MPPPPADRAERWFDKGLIRIKADAEELEELKGSINRAIRWLAIGAAEIIFELLRKGVTF